MTPIEKATAARQRHITERRNDIVEFARNCAFDGITLHDVMTIMLDPEAPWDAPYPRGLNKQTVKRDLEALVSEGRLRLQIDGKVYYGRGKTYFPTNIKDGDYPDWTPAEIEAFQRGDPAMKAKQEAIHQRDMDRIEARERAKAGTLN